MANTSAVAGWSISCWASRELVRRCHTRRRSRARCPLVRPTACPSPPTAGKQFPPTVPSVVERELLRVQQGPEQVAEHLVSRVAAGERLLHRRPPRRPSAARPSVRRNSSSVSFASSASRPSAASPARRAVLQLCQQAVAVLQVQQLRQGHVAAPLAGARRHPLGPGRTSSGSTTCDAGSGTCTARTPTG